MHNELSRTIWRAFLIYGLSISAAALWSPVAYSQSNITSLPGMLLNNQMNSQHRTWKKLMQPPQDNNRSEVSSPSTDTVIFTDRFRNPISQEEFIQQVRQHHQEMVEAEQRQLQDMNIEPPPPEDASFQ